MDDLYLLERCYFVLKSIVENESIEKKEIVELEDLIYDLKFRIYNEY